MLCGASDMKDVVTQFVEVTSQLGGEPWHYLSGEILYRNSATASWDRNSRRTVAAADLCVFVVLRDYGKLTWGTELRGALDEGKPFLILCLASTYDEYYALRANLNSTTAIADEGKRNLVETLTEVEFERQLTIVRFDYGNFAEVYRREASKLFAEGLEALQARSRREALAGLLVSPDKLSTRDLVVAEEIAVDEFEDKTIRKQAVLALLARGAASEDVALNLVRSREQGVQRLAIANLPGLYRQRPPDPDFLADCVALANDADDVGLLRRLIPAVFEIDVAAAITVLAGLDLTEIGTRRRLATALEANEEGIIRAGMNPAAIALLERCLQKSETEGWLARCRAYVERLRRADEVCP